jgi:N-acetylglucosaminyldiphosphoundecaprenol N-acetyl-beta-D-mannosaminyltransferase
MRLEVFGLPLDALTMDATVDRADELIQSGGEHQHVVLNAAKIVEAARNRELTRIIQECDLVNADGMAVVWAARILGHEVPERVAGVDFMDHLLVRAAERGYLVYFLGAREEVVKAVVEIESARHPGLRVAGWRNGYWSGDEEPDVVRAIADSEPAILLVAMSSPRKEEFLARHRALLSVPLVVGVGGSFDVVAGVTKRAPRWMQSTGFEWLYRLLQEPRRMLRRYLVGNSRFIALVAREWWRQR